MKKVICKTNVIINGTIRTKGTVLSIPEDITAEDAERLLLSGEEIEVLEAPVEVPEKQTEVSISKEAPVDDPVPVTFFSLPEQPAPHDLKDITNPSAATENKNGKKQTGKKTAE